MPTGCAVEVGADKGDLVENVCWIEPKLGVGNRLRCLPFQHDLDLDDLLAGFEGDHVACDLFAVDGDFLHAFADAVSGSRLTSGTRRRGTCASP